MSMKCVGSVSPLIQAPASRNQQQQLLHVSMHWLVCIPGRATLQAVSLSAHHLDEVSQALSHCAC